MFGKKRSGIISVFTYSDSGGRPENEDSASVYGDERQGMIAVLADGLGGHGGGREASKAAVDTLLRNFEQNPITEPEEFNVWFQEANQKVLSMQTRECEMKTTLVSLLIKNGIAIWAHVGDSRLYHFRGDRLSFRTFDHSVSQMSVLRGEIREDEIRGHVDRNKLLKAIGREETINIDISEKTDLSNGKHSFLLCTDGFWEYVTEADMEKALRQSASAKEWIMRMVKVLNKKAKPDNDNNTAVAIIYRGE